MTSWRKASASAAGNCVEVAWRKASASSQGECVEVAQQDDAVLVRDSKDRDGPVLTFTPAEWAAFLDGARKGEFERA